MIIIGLNKNITVTGQKNRIVLYEQLPYYISNDYLFYVNARTYYTPLVMVNIYCLIIICIVAYNG